ncbi:MAG: hypothetical protein EBW54_00760 [Betaproteobacteria bacterium]|nr:hypothetical protein [Betaproteobacteria bacterium]
MIYDFCGSAAVQGSFHRKRQRACTDSAAARTKGDYALLICADGARHAKHGGPAAKLTVEFLSDRLLEVAERALGKGSPAIMTDVIINTLIAARRHLEHAFPDASSDTLHCTLVACLLGPNHLCMIHLGDGFACAVQDRDANYQFVSSEPENADDLSTSFYLAELSWFKHLRVSILEGRFIFAACMTDGAQALFEEERGFAMRKLLEIASPSEPEGSQLAAYLDTALARLMSDDDKALCMLRRPQADDYLEHLVKTKRALIAYPSAAARQHAAQRVSARPAFRLLTAGMVKALRQRLGTGTSNRLGWYGLTLLICCAALFSFFISQQPQETEQLRAIKQLLEQSKKQGQNP